MQGPKRLNYLLISVLEQAGRKTAVPCSRHLDFGFVDFPTAVPAVVCKRDNTLRICCKIMNGAMAARFACTITARPANAIARSAITR
jgi:hypothetical protein